MSENQTRPTDGDVMAFLSAVEPEKKRNDSFTIMEMMQDITGEQPCLWGPSIIGFGSCHYRYESGREGDMPIVGFSPRKQAITLYLEYGFEAWDDLLNSLGKYKTGKVCLYIKSLKDVDVTVLREMISRSVAQTRKSHP
jgi:hypothetical protein